MNGNTMQMESVPRIRKELLVSDRLMVAFDFKPNPTTGHGRKWVLGEVRKLMRSLAKTGVTVKMNSGLRALGYDIIDEAHQYGLKYCADLKEADIPETLSIDGILLYETRVEFVTVYCATGEVSIAALKAQLPDTEVLGVTVLTSLKGADCYKVFALPKDEATKKLAQIGYLGNVDGFVSSAHEAGALRTEFGRYITINTPAIRPTWAIVPSDDQDPASIMTPLKAIRAGADRIIVGRPITQAKKPYDAVMRTLEEIDMALNEQ